MKVEHSRFEQQVHIELQHRGLAPHLYPLDTTIILNGEPTITNRENVTYSMIESKTFTTPDFLLKQMANLPIPIYLHGPPHKKRGVKRRDARIKKALEDAGFTPKIFHYSSPTKKRLREVCDEIEKYIQQF